MPPSALVLEIRGIDELERKLGKVEAALRLGPILRAAALSIKNEVARYPRHTIANSPANPTGRWYERGFGPRWMRRDGSVGGSRTSETLGRRWTTRASPREARIGNNASYAPFVQGRDQQAAFHARRGWKTLEDVGEKEAQRVIRQIEAAIRGAMR